ncbi:MAG: hypothetical protein ABI369_04115 [Acetobacteraceae bacterium]
MAEEMLAIPTARREARDVSGLFITLAFLLVLSGLAIVGLLCWWIFPRAPHPDLVPYPIPSYPPPRLQAAPHEDMVRFYRREMERLNSVGWIDRSQGLAHIPIDQAMRMIAKQGIKDWPAPPAEAKK